MDYTVETIKKAWTCKNRKKTPRLVITGGEPLLQSEALDKLIKELGNWNIEIETNGTIVPSDLQLFTCQINCSPKLQNSGNSKLVTIKKKAIKEISRWDGIFKFVVANREDVEEVEKDFVIPFKIYVNQVILMPLGTDKETLSENVKNIAECAKEKGYRLIDRLQIKIWGNVRKT